MTPYRHVLCPTDFSDVSLTALNYAMSFCREIDSKLKVIHVVDTTLLNVGNMVAVPEGMDELKKAARKNVAELCEELGLDESDVEVDYGNPAERIVAFAESTDVDLVIMGTHGYSGLSKMLLGSVTEKVLHHVKVPMLTVSARAPETPATLPRSVVLAVDFGPGTNDVLRHGVALAEHFGARLTGVHAVPIPYVVLNERSLERLSDEEIDAVRDTLTSARRDELSDLLRDTIGKRGDERASFEVVTDVGPVHKVLTDTADAKQADLIVMGAGGHGESGFGWLGSTCHKVVRASARPVLVAR